MTDSPTSAAAVRGKAIGLKHGAKSLLRNVIRHTDTHNRLLEESEMWQQFYRMKGRSIQDDENNRSREDRDRRSKRARKDSRDSEGDRGFQDLDIQKSFLYDDRQELRPYQRSERRGMKRAHMDDSSDDEWRSSSRGNGGASHSNVSGSTFWMRQLHKAEEGDPDRWGHAGFKELYPDAYVSDRSTRSDSSSKERKQKRKKRKYRDESNSRKSQKQKKKSKKKKHKRDESDRKRHSSKKRKRKDKRDIHEASRERPGKRQRSLTKSDSENKVTGAQRTLSKADLSSESSDSSSEESDQNKKRRRKNIKTENEREKDIVVSISRTDSSHRKKKRRRHK